MCFHNIDARSVVRTMVTTLFRHWQPLVATGTIILAAQWVYSRRALKRKVNPNEKVKELLPVEKSSMMMQNVQGITTLTWFTGDSETAHKVICARLSEIVSANPWLLGRLATSEGSPSLIYSIDEATLQQQLNQVFRYYAPGEDNVPQLTRTTPYNHIPDIISSILVKTANQHLNTDTPYFRVSIVPDYKDPSQRFALITSLAHCVGDGYTYYTIQNMLSQDKPIVSLRATRKPAVEKRIETALGGVDQACMLSDPPAGFMLRFMAGLIGSKLLGPPTVAHLFWIDEDWIAKHKQEAKDASNSSFVSTNDIVTAEFFKCCATDQGIMAVNFRGKVDDCLFSDAGNYFNYLICRPSDYASAALIRASVNELKQGGRKPLSSPLTSLEHLFSGGFLQTYYGAVSNWSTFCQPIHLESCNQELHIPILPTDSFSVPSRFVSGLFLFKPDGSGKLAAMFAGHPNVLDAVTMSGMRGPDVE